MPDPCLRWPGEPACATNSRPHAPAYGCVDSVCNTARDAQAGLLAQGAMPRRSRLAIGSFSAIISAASTTGVGRVEPVVSAATANAYSRPAAACRELGRFGNQKRKLSQKRALATTRDRRFNRLRYVPSSRVTRAFTLFMGKCFAGTNQSALQETPQIASSRLRNIRTMLFRARADQAPESFRGDS